MTARRVVRRTKTTERRTAKPKKAIAPAIEVGQTYVVDMPRNFTPTEERLVVSLSKYSASDSRDPGRWTLTIEDKRSGVRILDMNLTPEQFTEMFSGHAEADARFFRNEGLVGATYETQVVDIAFDHKKWAQREEIAQAELDRLFPGEGWRPSGVPFQANKAPVTVQTTGKLQLWAFRYTKEKTA